MEYKKVRVLSESESAYLAGIIDGEGTVTLSRGRKNAQRQLAVTVSSTDRELLEYVARVVGAGKITNKQIHKRNHSAAYTYQVYNRQALSILRQTVPFLRTYKRNRAEIALDGYLKVTPRNGKYSAEMIRLKEKFNDTFFAFSSANAKRL